MDLAKPGLIQLHFLPNALTTLQEYLEDYADTETRDIGEDLITQKLNEIPIEQIQNKTKEYLKKIKDGKRDLYF